MEITYVPIQDVAIGGNVLFTDTPVDGPKCVTHRDGSGLVVLRGVTRNQSKARFLVNYNANIALPTTGTAGPISLSLSISGEPIGSTLAEVTPAAVEEFFNVSGSAYVEANAGCCVTISVKNTSGVAIQVRNANLVVSRVS